MNSWYISQRLQIDKSCMLSADISGLTRSDKRKSRQQFLQSLIQKEDKLCVEFCGLLKRERRNQHSTVRWKTRHVNLKFRFVILIFSTLIEYCRSQVYVHDQFDFILDRSGLQLCHWILWGFHGVELFLMVDPLLASMFLWLLLNAVWGFPLTLWVVMKTTPRRWDVAYLSSLARDLCQ